MGKFVAAPLRSVTSRIRPAIPLLTLLLGAILQESIARADTVELRTGERITGAFKQATAEGAVIDVGGTLVTFPLEKVRAIYLGAESTSNREPSLYSDALDGLKTLQSLTASGISYRDYAPRVVETKSKVDKYLTSPVANDEAKRVAVRLAMQYHELAASAWSSSITRAPDAFSATGRALRENAGLSECALLKTLITETNASAQRVNAQLYQGSKPPKLPRGKTLEQVTQETAFNLTGRLLADDPRILWTCASLKLAEVEKQP